MKFLHLLVGFLVLAPAALSAQGVRMSADFLPLEVGNRWTYEIAGEDGRQLGQTDVTVQDHTIIDGRSFYVMSRFPFAHGGIDRTVLVRYDRREREFAIMTDDRELPLFQSDGASAEVLQQDASGLAARFVLNTPMVSLTFQRGVGIIEGLIEGENGQSLLKITSARLGDRNAPELALAGIPELPEPQSPEEQAQGLADNVGLITEENPQLDLEAAEVPEGYRFILTVTNTSDKLLPFHFNSGQSYDFLVTDVRAGPEVWRWSRRMFFTEVIRSEALLPNRQWMFEAVWNGRDNDLDPVPAGTYQLVGIVTTEPPIESDPLVFEVK